MKKFIMHAVQDGEGCDYTIGCGHAVRLIEAPGMREAVQVAMANYIDDWLDDLQSVKMFEVVSELEIEIQPLREHRKMIAEAEEKNRIEQEEWLKFQKLKAKFEG